MAGGGRGERQKERQRAFCVLSRSAGLGRALDTQLFLHEPLRKCYFAAYLICLFIFICFICLFNLIQFYDEGSDYAEDTLATVYHFLFLTVNPEQ